jgi:LysR family glycine cleavage system transcriptional activator
MPIKLPPLPSLRQFEAAARTGSFTKAASELGQTASAVSHAIDTLEKWLGVGLFRREARGVILTPAGEYFLPYVSDGLSMIALGAQRLPGRRTEQHVVISVAPAFAQRILMPLLPRFRALYPRIRLSIDTSHRQMRFPVDGADMSIRLGSGDWPDASAELLFKERLVPVASRCYIDSVTKDGQIDWPSVTFLRLSSVEGDWEDWKSAANMDFPIQEELQFDTIQLICDAASMGLGIAIGRLPLMNAELNSSRIVAASAHHPEISKGYWLVSPAGRETRSAVRSFRHWLLDEIARAFPSESSEASSVRTAASLTLPPPRANSSRLGKVVG